MIEDFRLAVGAAWLVKQELMSLDQEKIWSYYLPEIAAMDDQIAKAEQHLGHALDDRYKNFLKCANGWRAFYHTVDLFGTEDLIGGQRNETGEFVLSLLDDNVLKKNAVERDELLPIAATPLDKDLFVITRPHSAFPGEVIWFAGEKIDRFSTFDDYFLAMILYDRVAMQRFKEEGKDLD